MVKKIIGMVRKAYILVRLTRTLTNSFTVWRLYFAEKSLPPLKFRRGIVLHHSPDDGPVPLALEIFGDKEYRRHITFPTQGNMIDIGANIGANVLDWATSSDRFFIHAYEPNPKTFETLLRNIDSNALTGKVVVYNEAVGEKKGELKMWTNVPSLIATGYSNAKPCPGAVRINVPMVDLNEVVRRADGTIELMKIDTEGAEADILEGASESTFGMIKQIILEYHEQITPGSLKRCQRKLEFAGFHCRVVPNKKDNSVGLLYATS